MTQLIELAQNRKLTIRQGGRRYSVVVPPIPEAVWLGNFFDTLSFTIKRGEGETTRHNDVGSAAVELVERVAIEAEGYSHLNGARGWQSNIPLAHRWTFGAALVEAYPPGASEQPECCSDGTRTVRLEALWSAGATGAMCRHRNLAHHFSAPSAKHQERFRRAYLSVRKIAGVKRRGAPVSLAPKEPLTAHTLVSLYDLLIASVDGYSVNGEPLKDNRDQIVRHMDAFHKVAAARPLFSQGAAGIEELRSA